MVARAALELENGRRMGDIDFESAVAGLLRHRGRRIGRPLVILRHAWIKARGSWW